MRSALLIATSIVLAGCAGDAASADASTASAITELELEIEVYTWGVGIHAYEVDRPFDCNQKVWLDPGECGESTDVFFCDSEPPASCITAIRAEANGAVIAEGSYQAGSQSGGVAVDDAPELDLELVIEGCGGVARVPLTPGAPPVPVLEGFVDDGTRMEVTWRGDDLTASAVVGWGRGYGGHRCHVTDQQPVELPSAGLDPAYLVVYVTGYTAPIEHATDLGIARIRRGGVDTQEM